MIISCCFSATLMIWKKMVNLHIYYVTTSHDNFRWKEQKSIKTLQEAALCLQKRRNPCSSGASFLFFSALYFFPVFTPPGKHYCIDTASQNLITSWFYCLFGWLMNWWHRLLRWHQQQTWLGETKNVPPGDGRIRTGSASMKVNMLPLSHHCPAMHSLF